MYGSTVALVVAALYAGTSFLLFQFPTLLHRKKKFQFRCRHISHRGGAGEQLENTLTAFRHAVECGTEMLEIDCQITADGVVVVSHDDHLERVADVDAYISTLHYKDLPPILNSLPLQFNTNFVCESDSCDTKIPTLEEVFTEFRTLPINIDIKREDPQLIQKVSDLIKKYRREHLTVWGNFQDTVCSKCFEKQPTFSLQTESETANHLTPARYANCLRLLMRRCLFRHLQKRGIQIYIWVLNSESEYERAFQQLGADGVMTDFPSKLTSYLGNNGL